jgi:ubiquinone/menaquinone biosynthesis C-methylase UbiE
LFLNAGYPVIAVEPNREMREKLAELLSHFSNLTTINGTAENTTLQDNSVDMIVAGQAFHWFDQSKSKEEFKGF